MSETDTVLEELEAALIAEALRRDWQHKYAKFAKGGEQSLLVHSINVFSVTRVLASAAFSLSRQETLIACIAGFLHDIQKERDRWQQAAIAFMDGARGLDSEFSHDDGSPEALEQVVGFLKNVESAIRGAGLKDTIEDLGRRVLNVVVYTHDSRNQADAARRRRQVGAIDKLTQVIRLADSICSIKAPSDIVRLNHDPDLPDNARLSFEYHELGRIRGLLSSFLNEAIIDVLKEEGYIPLLYFGHGAVYMLVGDPKEETVGASGLRGKLSQAITRKVEQFIASDTFSTGLENAVLGAYNATKWPGAHIVRKYHIERLLGTISQNRGANRDVREGEKMWEKMQGNEAHRDAADTFVNRTGSDPGPIIASALSDFYVLVYFADFVKKYKEYAERQGMGGQYVADVDSWLTEEGIGFTTKELIGFDHRTPDDEKLGAIERLWFGPGDREGLHLSPDRRDILVKRFRAVMEKIVDAYVSCADPVVTDACISILLKDLYHAPESTVDDGDMRESASTVTERYFHGKKPSKRICSLCGFEGEGDAVAGVFGDGAQKFTNLLPAGSTIGKGKKAQVCAACMVEGMLRSAFFQGTPALTIIVMPDLSLSPPVHVEWAASVERFVQLEKLGLSPAKSWNMLDVYRALVKKGGLQTSHHLMTMLRPTNKSVKELTRFLQDEYDDPHDIEFDPPDALSDVTFERLARAHLAGRIAIKETCLEGYVPPKRTQSTCYLTPSHLFVFLCDPLKEDRERKESASSSAIRAVMLCLILAEVFHARVIAVEGFTPLADTTVRGTVKVEMPAPAVIGLHNLGIGAVVRLHEMRGALQKIAALMLISTYVEGLGKDRLLRLTSMNRGAILRRAQTENLKRWQERRVSEYLQYLPEVALEERVWSEVIY